MTKHNENIVREVLDTLYEANGAILGLTALDTELEMQIKIQQNECATTRRIDRAISAIQQLELGNHWHKVSEELPKVDKYRKCIKVFARKGDDVFVAFYSVMAGFSLSSSFYTEYALSGITHWMPIPEIKED